jgi:hypothetical protein
MKSDYQISSSSVYNTFPFPALSSVQRSELVHFAEEILRIRENFNEVNLGDLYDPALMPLELQKMHAKLDVTVQKIFGIKNNASDAEILSVLFNLYAQAADTTLL